MKFILTKEQEMLQEPLKILLVEKGHSYEEGGIRIVPEFVEDAVLCVERCGQEAVIRCGQKAHFFRGVGHLLRHIGEENFKKEETVYLDSLGAMPDCSRNGVPSVEMLKGTIRTMALLGMNELFLYTEDTYELEGYPYFGAFRGRYTKEELKECDAYGEMFGVELIPCIQTLAHVATFLRWSASAELRDNGEILLAEDEKVYRLIETMIKELSESFHTRKIHLGMDEAHNLGLGVYRLRHGYTDQLTIMKRHLSKVEEFCEKYGMEPMIWSDMYFRVAGKDCGYYGVPEDYEWPETEKPKRDTTMVYWDYYNHNADDYRRMLHLHKKLSDKVYFAGGGWTWNGIAPNFGKAFDTTRIAMKVMKEKDVRCGFMTFWMDDGTETPFASGLLPLVLFAEEGFKLETTDEDVEEGMKLFQDADVSDWMLLNKFDCLPGTDEKNEHAANPSKALLYQDPLLGLFDGQYEGYDMYGHYGKLAKELRAVEEKGVDYRGIFKCYRALAELLSVKGSLGLDIRRAYLEKDKAWLGSIAEEQIEVCLQKLEEYHELRENIWFEECKPNGYEVLDIRLGGLRARLLSARKRLNDYLEEKVEKLPELEEERLPYRRTQEEGMQTPINCNRWEYLVSAGNVGPGTC